MDKEKLINLYLDWKKNFQHLTNFARHYNISELQAKQIINLGKRYYLRGI